MKGWTLAFGHLWLHATYYSDGCGRHIAVRYRRASQQKEVARVRALISRHRHSRPPSVHAHITGIPASMDVPPSSSHRATVSPMKPCRIRGEAAREPGTDAQSSSLYCSAEHQRKEPRKGLYCDWTKIGCGRMN